MASNDSDDLSGLNSPCSSAFLAPKCFFEPFLRKEGRKEAKSTCRPACSYLAAGKNDLILPLAPEERGEELVPRLLLPLRPAAPRRVNLIRIYILKFCLKLIKYTVYTVYTAITS